MNSTRSGSGGYKRRKSPNGTTGISAESRARMDAVDAECRRRANAVQATPASGVQATPAQAAAAYQAESAGRTRPLVEVQV